MNKRWIHDSLQSLTDTLERGTKSLGASVLVLDPRLGNERAIPGVGRSVVGRKKGEGGGWGIYLKYCAKSCRRNLRCALGKAW